MSTDLLALRSQPRRQLRVDRSWGRGTIRAQLKSEAGEEVVVLGRHLVRAAQ